MIQNYNFNEIEPEMLKFWEDNKSYKKLRIRYKNKPRYYFLHGPPYTSGRIHIAHAWNNALKDIIIRYKKMQGLNVWDRFGYDMHGLPTENKVQKDLNLKDKEAIEKYGMDKFIKHCIDFSEKNAEIMSKDLLRLGVWMDYENAYYPIRNSFIENEWWFVKKAHENKRLYKGKKIMHWCASCETALAKHELEYENVKDTSIFLKFRVADNEDEFLIIWTTTPWTIPYNLAVMVNPELEYIKAKVENETWIVAKGLAGPFIRSVADKEYEVLEEFKGEKLEGLRYIHPFYVELKQQFEDHKKFCQKPENIHTVILSEQYVTLDAGSGLVHCAPGCGPEDYEVGRDYGIGPFNNLNEKGEFADMGKYTGMTAKKDDSKFIEEFKNKSALIETSEVEHEYAHCWRCKNPVVFRTTEQWFLKIEDLIPKMVEDNKNINWVPSFGITAFDSWLTALKDNSISRQRFWGTPIPIWICDKCGKTAVIGSAAELKEKAANKVPKDLHKPWIDEVKLKCDCGSTCSRVHDILDVWIDSGTLSFNCLDYPLDSKNWGLYPADLILEATEQIRLWFSMLHICSEVALGNSCFKNVYMHGMILDYQGLKMSKSLGNIISPYEVIDKHGADVLRYYMCSGAAGENFNFSWDDVKIKQRNLTVLWNVHKFLINLCKELDFNPAKANEKDFASLYELEEKFMISRLNSTIKEVTELFEKYRIDQTISKIEDLYLDLSREYMQIIRDKSSIGSDMEKKLVAYTIYKVIENVLAMFSVICPFISEKMYQNLKTEFGLQEESITLLAWPSASKTKINEKLEAAYGQASRIIQSILFAREKMQLGVRWPLKKVIIQSSDKEVLSAVKIMIDIIKNQTNVKEIEAKEKFSDVRTVIKADYNKIGPAFKEDSPKIIADLVKESPEKIMKHIEKEGKFTMKVSRKEYSITRDHILIERVVPKNFIESDFKNGFAYVDMERTKELDAEGYSREIMRRVQSLRKDAGLNKIDSISLHLTLDKELSEMIAPFEEQIKEKVGAKDYHVSDSEPNDTFTNNAKEKIKGKEVGIWLRKV